MRRASGPRGAVRLRWPRHALSRPGDPPCYMIATPDETAAPLASALVRAGRAGSGPLMDRRAFIGALTGGLLAAPLAAGAQLTGQRPRIGYLASGGPPRHSTEVFIERLRELGYQQGRNLEFEFRSPRDAGNVEQLRELAAGLVSLRVATFSSPPAPLPPRPLSTQPAQYPYPWSSWRSTIPLAGA